MDNNVNIFDNERLNDIYQKVVNGEITSTAGLNLTLDELFTMDKNGDFLLKDNLKHSCYHFHHMYNLFYHKKIVICLVHI